MTEQELEYKRYQDEIAFLENGFFAPEEFPHYHLAIVMMVDNLEKEKGAHIFKYFSIQDLFSIFFGGTNGKQKPSDKPFEIAAQDRPLGKYLSNEEFEEAKKVIIQKRAEILAEAAKKKKEKDDQPYLYKTTIKTDKKYCEVVGKYGGGKDVSLLFEKYPDKDSHYAFVAVYKNSHFTMEMAMEWCEKNNRKLFDDYIGELCGNEAWIYDNVDEEARSKIKTTKQFVKMMDKYDKDGYFKPDEWQSVLDDENWSVINYKSDDDYTIQIGGDWQAEMCIRMVGFGAEVQKEMADRA